MKYQNEMDLRRDVAKVIHKMAEDLADSPLSRRTQISNQIGYYQGYCAAKNWQTAVDTVIAWMDMS